MLTVHDDMIFTRLADLIDDSDLVWVLDCMPVDAVVQCVQPAPKQPGIVAIGK